MRDTLRRTVTLTPLVLATLTVLASSVYACGRERWAAKTLSDGVEIDIAHPISATVDQLRALPRPARVDGFDSSRAGAERRIYRIQATLVAFKLENDGDIHLAIAQPDSPFHTMIAEIPDPACMQGASRQYIDAVAKTRQAFIGEYGSPEPYFRHTHRPIFLEGPAFFDFPHHQYGLAPNAIEIHPVLAIGTDREPAAAGPAPRITVRPPAPTADLTPDEAATHVGQTVTVCGTVASAAYLARSYSRPTLLDLDRPHPNEIFTVVIRSEDRAAFGAPERTLMGKRICLTGLVELYRGRPEMTVRDPRQLSIR